MIVFNLRVTALLPTGVDHCSEEIGSQTDLLCLPAQRSLYFVRLDNFTGICIYVEDTDFISQTYCVLLSLGIVSSFMSGKFIFNYVFKYMFSFITIIIVMVIIGGGF